MSKTQEATAGAVSRGTPYRVTLLITAEPDDDPPMFWDWQELLDSPHPVECVKVEPLSAEVEPD